MLIAVRFSAAPMQANAAVANAYVADITAPAAAPLRAARRDVRHRLHPGPAMGGTLGAIDIHLRSSPPVRWAIANWLCTVFVLPESLPPERRRAFEWRRANPSRRCPAWRAARRRAADRGDRPGGQPGAVHAAPSWVLHNTLKVRLGPAENGWSLFVVGVMSALVQGVAAPPAQALSPQRLWPRWAWSPPR